MFLALDAVPDYEGVVAQRVSGPYHPPQLQRRPESRFPRAVQTVPSQTPGWRKPYLYEWPHEFRPQRRLERFFTPEEIKEIVALQSTRITRIIHGTLTRSVSDVLIDNCLANWGLGPQPACRAGE